MQLESRILVLGSGERLGALWSPSCGAEAEEFGRERERAGVGEKRTMVWVT